MGKCNNCYKENILKRCGRCKRKYYCSKACQRKDWPEHRYLCGPRHRAAFNNIRHDPRDGCDSECAIRMENAVHASDSRTLEAVWCHECVSRWLVFTTTNTTPVNGRYEVLCVMKQKLGSLSMENNDLGEEMNMLEYMMRGFACNGIISSACDQRLFIPTLSTILEIEPDIVLGSFFPRRFYWESELSREAIRLVTIFWCSVVCHVHSVVPTVDLCKIIMSYYANSSHPGMLTSFCH